MSARAHPCLHNPWKAVLQLPPCASLLYPVCPCRRCSACVCDVLPPFSIRSSSAWPRITSRAGSPSLARFGFVACSLAFRCPLGSTVQHVAASTSPPYATRAVWCASREHRLSAPAPLPHVYVCICFHSLPTSFVAFSRLIWRSASRSRSFIDACTVTRLRAGRVRQEILCRHLSLKPLSSSHWRISLSGSELPQRRRAHICVWKQFVEYSSLMCLRNSNISVNEQTTLCVGTFMWGFLSLGLFLPLGST